MELGNLMRQKPKENHSKKRNPGVKKEQRNVGVNSENVNPLKNQPSRPGAVDTHPLWGGIYCVTSPPRQVVI